MSVFELTPTGPTPQRLNERTPVAIGLFAGEDFERAQADIAGLSNFLDYDDWLDRQEGLQIGLDMAGFAATIVRIDLASFLEWRRRTGAGPGEAALDAFATVTYAMRTASITRVLAVISASDFTRHASALATITGGRDYDGWSRHRQTLRVKTEALGGRVERLSVRLEEILAWCVCLGQTASEETLDRYAQLTLERLTTSNSR